MYTTLDMKQLSAFGLLLCGSLLCPRPALAQIAPLDPGAIAPPPATATSPVQGQPQPESPPPSATIPSPPPQAPTATPAPTMMRHAPRVMSITAGYAYNPLSYLPLSASTPDGKYRNHGLRIDWKAGWQVGGFQSGWGSYVGFFAGFFYNFGQEVADNLGLNYGIFAKHNIFPGRRWRPYLAYGLGAIQVWVREREGRGIGHVTRLSVGLDAKVSERVALEFDASYQFNILPSFAVDGVAARSYDFHSISFTTGIWYGR